MVNFRVLFSVLIIIGCSFLASGQSSPDPANYTNVANVLPPSPNAASLGKYGGVNLNLSQGSLDLTIPLYDYLSSSIKLPISLSYNSSSIRVDEIASCVGMSWALNNGGVITRTVYGMPDESRPRMSPPSNFPAQTDSLLYFLQDITIPANGMGLWDGQPDLFSFNFNGYSGKFILDSSLANPILLTYSGLKIESHLGSLDTTWHFRITTPDGVQYYFGGSAAIDLSHSHQVGTDAGRTDPYTPPTAYYLTKIVHPDGDSVWFNYTAYNSTYKYCINESMIGWTPIQTFASCDLGPPSIPNSNPTSYTSINAAGVLVQQINSSGGARVVFNYINRKDNIGDLLSSIYVYQPGQLSPTRTFTLNYQYSVSSAFNNSYTDSSCIYRPFLMSVTENSGDSTLHKAYNFKYNNINSLPPRLSYAQDDYGYFNGKANSTLLPPPESVQYQYYLPAATANRKIDTNYCLTGLLTNVIYPTGGQDSIVYEPNYVFGNAAVSPPDSLYSITARGGFRTGPIITDTFNVLTTQSFIMYGNTYYVGNPALTDSLHDKGWTTLTDITNPANPEVIFAQIVPLGSNWSQAVSLIAGKVYTVSVQASGDTVFCTAFFNYIKGATQFQYMNQVTGGNRVKRVITRDPVTNSSIIKRYYYGALNSLNTSSAISIYSPLYEKLTKYFVSCQPDGLPDWSYNEFDYPSVYSTTQCNLFEYGGFPVSYAAVTESFGENFENGGIEHDFTHYADQPGDPLIGDFLISGPRTSYAWLNGKEIYTYTFKNQGGNMIPVKKIYTRYAQDPRVNNTYSSYLTNQKYVANATWEPPIQYQFDAYDLLVYSYLQRWMYADSVISVTYDQSGVNQVTDTVVTVYGNPAHALPTQVSSSASDFRIEKMNYFYPYDTVLSGNAETARQALISKYIISPILLNVKTKGGDTVYVERTDYNVFTNGLVLPQVYNLQIGNNPIAPRLQMYGYNNSGKLLEESKIQDAHSSYIWDYNSVYPVAEVKNASQTDIAYTSFEADGKGNWTFTGSPSIAGGAITGSQSYSLSTGGSISKSGLTSATKYVVSYWSKGSVSVSGGTQTNSITGKTINGWTYHELMVTGTTSVSISGSSYIDELRLYPSDAQMVTYTYEPLIGMTSQCDADNKIQYYEYDALGRLQDIKDQDSNIIKTFEYHYQQSGQQ